tara:strand:- start:19203 stop:20387 length:1185 start_codon:yes stop_codon:yes gene_type:complete
MTQPFVPNRTGRDHRLDVIRGLALLDIFINHVPGNPLERYTSRNFGFSDAAEAFVLMSGIAVALAYSGGFFKRDHLKAIGRILRRARTLYLVHIAIMSLALVIVGTGLYVFGAETIAKNVNFTRFQTDTIKALIGVPLLGYQLGYFNILPLYVVLLFAAIGYLYVGVRSVWAMMAIAFGIWCFAHLTEINFPNWPGKWGWFFNPLGWQLVFAFGLAFGLSVKTGRAFVPFSRVLYALAWAFVIWSGYWVKMEMGAVPGLAALPDLFADTNKGALAFLRLVHVLALAYVIVHTRFIGWLLSTVVFRPVAMVGRNGLAVFASGSVLAIFLQVLFEAWPVGDAVKVAVIVTGLAAQFLIAFYFDRRKKAARAAPARASGGQAPARITARHPSEVATS